MSDRFVQTTSKVFWPNHWLSAHGAGLIEAMFPDGGAPDDIGVKTLVRTHERMVMKLTLGERTTLLKAFNTSENTAVVARYREIGVLANLQMSDLIPPLLAYSKSGNWIMSQFMDGADLEDVITEENALDHASALGEWYARFTDVMEVQSQEAASDWHTYLSQYQSLRRIGLTKAQQDTLRAMPINRRLIAKNDSNLRNFIVDEGGKLIGFDFEKAELKPYGYDIIVTGRILVRKFPHMMLDLTEALVDGWGRGTDAITPAQMLDLTRIFAVTTAFTLVDEADARLHRRMRSYNDSSAEPVSRIHEAPYMTDEIVDQSEATGPGLVEHLREAVRRFETAKPDDGQSTDQIVIRSATPEKPTDAPETRELQFCGTCKGSCCASGAENMAFIDTPLLQRTRDTLGLGSLEEAIRHYAELLPQRHVKGSCFFHTESGCAIPREQRSDVCNAFKCHALRSFQAMVGKLDKDARVLVFSGNDDGVKRAMFMQGNTVANVDPGLLDVAHQEVSTHRG